MTTYIPWYRHPRTRDNPITKTGGANFGFVDGHVGSNKLSDLVEQQGTTSKTTLKAMWSTKDTELLGFY
jgi:prepilin-type processing-associated H-X9-DG protein